MLNVVVVGQIRGWSRFRATLEQLRRDAASARLVLSTWTDQLEQYPDIRADLDDLGVAVVESPPLEIDSAGNAERQARLLDIGLGGFAESDVVVKLRTDVVISSDHVRSMADDVDRARRISGSPWSGGLDRPVVVPWWAPTVPFQLGDEVLAGTAADLRRCNRIDPEVAMVCTHIARFSAPFQELPSWRFCVETVLRPWTRIEASKGANREYAARRGVPAGRPIRFAHPSSRPYFRSTTALPAMQYALADAHFLVGRAFRVHNPTPTRDMYLDRMGPWVNIPAVESRSPSDDPLDPRFQQVRYDEARDLVRELCEHPRYDVYATRMRELEERSSRLWEPVPFDVARSRRQGTVWYWRRAAAAQARAARRSIAAPDRGAT